MTYLTQTEQHNCWKTCVAMLLDVSSDDLPLEAGVVDRQLSVYALRVFLWKHFDKTYVEAGEEARSFLRMTSDPHLIIGECERTTAENGAWHAVVGVSGVPCWDPHPSRAGLTRVLRYGFLEQIPVAVRSEFEQRERRGDPWARCRCSACVEVARAA